MTPTDCRRFIRRVVRHVFVVVPVIVYLLTVSHYLGAPDTAVIMDAMMRPVLSAHACNHNLTNLIGYALHQLPPGDFMLRFHLVSVLCGSAAVILFYFLMLRLGAGPAPASLCAAIFMVSHSMWWHSTVVENYALSIVFLMTSLILVTADQESRTGSRPNSRCLAGMFFVAGLSLFNHIQNGVLAAACVLYFLFMIRRLRGRIVSTGLICAAAFVAGMAPYLLTLIVELMQSGDCAETLRWAGGGGFRQLMFRYDMVSSVLSLGRWIFMQFPSFFLVFIALGIGLSAMDKERRLFFVFLYTVLLINTGFFMGYTTWDQFSFYLPSFAALSVLGGYAVIQVNRRLNTGMRVLMVCVLASCVILPVFVYSNIGIWAKGSGYWGRRYGMIERDYRSRYDLVGYMTNPDKRDGGSIELFARLVLKKLPPDAILIDDCSTFYQLEFLRNHEGLRPDLEIRMIQPLGIEGWGTEPGEITCLVLTTDRPVFFVTSVGPCERIIERIAGKNRRVEPFSLGNHAEIYELVSED